MSNLVLTSAVTPDNAVVSAAFVTKSLVAAVIAVETSAADTPGLFCMYVVMAAVTSAAVKLGLAFSAAVICAETSAADKPFGNLIPAMAVSMSFLVAKSLVASEMAVLMSAAARPGLLSM